MRRVASGKWPTSHSANGVVVLWPTHLRIPPVKLKAGVCTCLKAEGVTFSFTFDVFLLNGSDLYPLFFFPSWGV